jgi:hypothetical protein
MRTPLEIINLRNPLAPPHELGLGHIWRPDAILSVRERLIKGGYLGEIRLHDENIKKAEVRPGAIIGMTLVGPSWIPVARDRMAEIRGECGPETQFIVGGTLVSGLTEKEIKTLFGANVVSGMQSAQLERILHLPAHSIPPREQVAIHSSWDAFALSEEEKALYVKAEASFYLADGCIFKCDFCAANKGVRESYREVGIEEDLRAYLDVAASYGVQDLQFYTTNLDLFQSPRALQGFLQVLEAINHEHTVRMKWRGLATLPMFLNATRAYPHLLERMKECGFTRFDFGVDGGPNVWKRINKGFVTEDKTRQVLETLKPVGLDAGIFMVLGHPGVDTPETVGEAEDYLKSLVSEYGVTPRPYVSTAFVPGSASWAMASPQKQALLRDPSLFYSLEYAAYASWVKGQQPQNIAAINEAYESMLRLPNCPTKPVTPILPEMGLEERELTRERNYGQYDL